MASPQGGRCRRHRHNSNIKILHLPPAIVGGFSYICEKDNIMTYDLARWDGKTYKVDLPEGTTEIAGVIVSGDEILVWPSYCDPWGDERVEDFYEGGWRKTLKDGSWVEE